MPQSDETKALNRIAQALVRQNEIANEMLIEQQVMNRMYLKQNFNLTFEEARDYATEV